MIANNDFLSARFFILTQAIIDKQSSGVLFVYPVIPIVKRDITYACVAFRSVARTAAAE